MQFEQFMIAYTFCVQEYKSLQSSPGESNTGVTWRVEKKPEEDDYDYDDLEARGKFVHKGAFLDDILVGGGHQ